MRQTLSIDIGGSALKAMLFDERGTRLGERIRVPTPRPATTTALLAEIRKIVTSIGKFERVSVGFPGVVIHGRTMTAVNLDPSWIGFRLEETLKKELGVPVRVMNDADIQGHGVISGQGMEMVLTLGTGMGSVIFIDGKCVPNLELGHQPFRKGKTYEEYIGGAALERVGKKRFNQRVRRVVRQIQPIFNPDTLYLGGGNARLLTIGLPPNVKIVDNDAGLSGGLMLWNEP